MDAEKLNWKVAGPVTGLGLVAIAGALVLGHFTSEAFSSVLVNVGTTLSLVGVLVVFERRVLRRVEHRTAQVVRSAVQEETSDLRDRVIRLEDLEAGQEAERARRAKEAEQVVDSVLSGAITQESIGRLLVTGYERRLFDERDFSVRTSAEPGAHTLRLMPYVAAGKVIFVFLDFEPFQIDQSSVRLDDKNLAPAHRESTAIWGDDDDAASVAGELEDGLARKNLPLHGFSLTFAITMLAKSVALMQRARAADPGSGERLEGALRLLINDGWAITSAGLESTHAEVCYRYEPGRFAIPLVQVQPGAMAMFAVKIPSILVASDPQLAEAVAWVRDRQDWEVILTP